VIEIIKQSKNWWDISNSGWKRLNAGRSMSNLIREGISNVFDLNDISGAMITIEEGHVIIEDDSKHGFSDSGLISTVFMTDKEDNHQMRGRKGRGLKELISASNRAIVETIGFTVVFDENGRIEQRNDRTIGTKVEVWSDQETWKGEHVQEALKHLRMFIPPDNLCLTVNDKIITSPESVKIINPIDLKTTVIKDGIQVDEVRTTEVQLFKKKTKKAWIYEMGIPIQEIETPWSINVQQRVPMNDHRDNVERGYLGKLYGSIVNRMIDNISDETMREEWFTENAWNYEYNVREKIVKRLIKEVKAAVKTDNKRANDQAKTHGYKLIDISHYPCGLANIIGSHIEKSTKVAEMIESEVKDTPVTPDDSHTKFIEVHAWLSKELLGIDIKVGFFDRPRGFDEYLKAADFNKAELTVRYNINPDCETEFDKPMSSLALSILVHELAHYWFYEHNKDFANKVEELAGKLANLIYIKHVMIPHSGKMKAKDYDTITIKCADCGIDWEIKPQDKHQTSRCRICQIKHKKKKRLENKINKQFQGVDNGGSVEVSQEGPR